MKKIVSILFVSSFLVVGAASAAVMGPGMMGYGQNNSSSSELGGQATIDAALQDIYKTQNVNAQNQIDCAKVSDDQFEKLGDAYMGYGITEQQHTAMENMMGGEGSATLRQAHINMGRAYLGCWANYNGYPAMMSMMGGVAQNPPYGYGQGYGMMGSWPSMMSGYYGSFAWFGWLTMLLLWVLLILGIVAIVKWLRKH